MGRFNNKTSRRFLVAIFSIYLLAFAARLILSSIDYSRVDGGRAPLFARSTWAFADGGTQEYEGFGYKLIHRHRIHENDGQFGYMSGPVLKYKWNYVLIPLPNLQNLRFIPREE